MKNFIKRYSILCILGCISLAALGQTLTQELQLEKAKKELEEKGVAEDEVKAKLKEKGIDLDNLKPEQLPSLEEDIKIAIAEIKAEAADTATNGKDIVSQLETDVTLPLENELNATLGDDKGVDSKEDGASSEEALSEKLAENLKNKYQVKTNIFGHHIFFDKSVNLYRTTSSSTTPNSYVLDVGDKIAINIFGASQADLIYEIEEDGFIRPSGLYKIYLKGITISKAKVLLKNRFRQAYMFSDGQFNVDLHTARTITVNIFGEVVQPGSYTISALNTTLNALIASGGITSKAGIRNIKIISKGEEKILDVYDFIANPQIAYDYYLRDNDIIYVSRIGSLVTAKGNGFKREGRFELKEGEGLADLLEFTEGLSSRAYTKKVNYLTYDGEEQNLNTYTLEELKQLNLELSDGDIISIGTSAIKYENYVRVNGAVRHPGEYEFSEGDRVGDVLEKAFIEEETFSEFAYLTRKNTDSTFKLLRVYVDDIMSDKSSSRNFALQKGDVLTLYGKSSFVDNYRFSISGAVRKPNNYFYDPEDNITIYDAIMMSKGLKTNATEFGYIVGKRLENSQERDYTVINIGEIMRNSDSPANVKIKPNDKIVIPSTEEYTDSFKVSISGAVRKPGEYIYDPTLRVKDMLLMAGGLKLEAATNKVDVFRLGIDENSPTRTYATSIILDRNLDPFNDSDTLVLQPFDKIVVRNTPEFEPMQFVQIEGEVKYPGQYAIVGQNETISSLVERAGGITQEAFPEASSFIRSEDSIGYIITRIDQAIKGSKKYDIFIKNGDSITIPKMIDVIKIDRFGTNSDDMYAVHTLGGEDSSGVLNFVVNYKKKRANWYIKEFAGGFDRGVAKKSKTLVKFPNGQVKKTKNVLLFKIYPRVRRGSSIVLSPTKKYLRKLEKQKRIAEGLQVEEKEKLSLSERLSNFQALVTIATGTVTTTVTSFLLIRDLR